MQQSTGTFIVLEGSDGSGKGTQFRLLTERLKAVGYDVEIFDFPQYNRESSYFVRQYLTGELGPASSISPYTASLFYALDRFEASSRIRQALEQGKVVLSNRYVGSNMAHQGSKLADPIEQRSFFVWEDSLEYQLLGIPRPNLNIFLRVPAETAFELIGKKEAREYTKKTRDEHEKDMNHLRNSIKTYDLLCELFPNDFVKIECIKDDALQSIPDINNQIWEVIQGILPSRPSTPGKAVTINLSDSVIKTPKDETPASSELDTMTIKLPVSLVVANELKHWTNKHNLRSWASANYAYYIPRNLSAPATQKYKDLMSKIVASRKALDKHIKDTKSPEIASLMATPMAAQLDLDLSFSENDIDSALERLASLSLFEADELAKKIYQKATEAWPKKYKKDSNFKSTTMPEKIDSIIDRIVNIHLPETMSDSTRELSLLTYSPKNEFSVLADIVYSHSDLDRKDLEQQLGTLNYQEKSNMLQEALKSNTGKIGNEYRYSIDVIANKVVINDLEMIAGHKNIKIQPLTPRFGYETPEYLDKISATENFLDIFDTSLELYSVLQATSSSSEAIYAVMAGHKTRFQLQCDLAYLKELLNSSLASLDTIKGNIKELLAEVHPIAYEMLSTTKELVQPKKKRRRKRH